MRSLGSSPRPLKCSYSHLGLRGCSQMCGMTCWVPGKYDCSVCARAELAGQLLEHSLFCGVNHPSSAEILSPQSHRGVPESLDLEISFFKNPLYCHQDLRFLLILHVYWNALKNIENWKICLRTLMVVSKWQWHPLTPAFSFGLGLWLAVKSGTT